MSDERMNLPMGGTEFDRVDEMLAGKVLGDLALAEARDLAARRDRAQDRMEQELEYAAAAVLLAQPALQQQEQMPAALRERIAAEGKVFLGPPKPMTQRPSVAWLLAAAASILAIGGWWNRPEEGKPAPAPQAAELRQRLVQTGMQELAWSRTPDEAAAKAEGGVVWSQTKQEGYMRFKGLAVNDPGKWTYQLWIFDENRDQRFPVDGGVFDVKGDEVVVPIQAKLPVGKAVLFAITVEPPGGVVVSKRERIVLTAKPS